MDGNIRIDSSTISDVVEVRREVEERLRLHAERLVRLQDARQELEAGLDRALRPAVLLCLERVHLDRHFRRGDEVRHEVELPAAQLRAVAEVEILRQSVVLPAARVDDGGAPPDPGGAVEIEEVPGPVPAAVLEDEVPVEQDRLDPGQQRVILVDVPPARLHHAHLRVGEMVDRPQEKVGRGNEIGVEDGDELACAPVPCRPRAPPLCTRCGRRDGCT